MTEGWRDTPIEPRGETKLGISFRPRQAEAFGLDPVPLLRSLLAYPFQLIRLGAYWNRMMPEPGRFEPGDLDWQVEAAERSGKQIILCVGAVKTFGYPEFFVPGHLLAEPLQEGRLVRASEHESLLESATAFVTRIVERFRDRRSVVGWQVEHEAVDPLGMEHSWRLSVDFVEREVAAVRSADPTRPIVISGFLPTSLPVRLQQWWRTRDQGDSLAVAQRLADVVGIDYYPRHALAGFGGTTIYLDGSKGPWQKYRQLVSWAAAHGRRLMVTEGQAEPWETVTTPPNPVGKQMFSCSPEQLIQNYNSWIRFSRIGGVSLDSYLFWGAEYWVVRSLDGDSSYLEAFDRVLV